MCEARQTAGVSLPRAAGVLLAVSSLPSPYGIGSFGKAARDWLRFLRDAGQKYWQILPLGPTGWGDSPYQSFSAFAVSPYYIDLDTLAAEGLLSPDEAQGTSWGGRADRADYAALYRRREPLLRKAFARFSGSAAFDEFRARQDHWLSDYGLFMAIKKKQKGRSWLEWDEKFRFRDEAALGRFRLRFAAEIDFHSFTQYLVRSQWLSIREYARELGVSIIGDMPIYVALDSADTWAKGELFLLDEKRRPLRVAGVPPDPFSALGQLWGNPLYRWDLHAETGFAWWLSRLAVSRELYDILRIDHFRGFESYFSIDASATDARGGEWVKGPGLAFIEAVKRGLPGMNIIAEDLGYLTAEVRALLKASGFPGMKVLQFAFDSREASDYMPYTYGRNCVVYTGTHDNPTSSGWFKSARPEDTALAMDFFGIKKAGEGGRAFIRAALASVADTAIIPMQDYLGLDDRARMNTPSSVGGNNWLWRMKPGAADSALAAKMHRLAQVYGRLVY
ncbi:MAG: 4-alpha-glucanotransferase [Treponema sp.]|jgi:4-alpha-glucanotransferase|nr:4-alpha-glucanotransferase [Treponema sp.]